MTASNIDIERRLELATKELLQACTLVTAYVTAAGVRLRSDSSSAVDYPCVLIQVLNTMEFGNQTGWYQCTLQVAAQTYRNNDKSRATLKQILGALRGWAQQTTLPTQYNATTSAKTAATALDVRDAWLDGPSFDPGEDKINELVLPLAVLCRPTQATTT